MFTLKVVFLWLYLSVVVGHNIGAAEYCKSETKISDDEFSELQPRSIKPYSQTQKCFAGCMLRKMNLIVDGTFSANELFKMAKTVIKDEEKLKKAEQIINECAKIVQSKTDECEIGGIITPCVWDGFHKAGLSGIRNTSENNMNKND